MEKGATEVSAYISHGVLSGPAVQRITDGPLKELVITDSIEQPNEVLNCGKIRTVSVAPLIGEAIRRIANEESVSKLFD
jgi:ribose-phosphate pyrophosphokinase